MSHHRSDITARYALLKAVLFHSIGQVIPWGKLRDTLQAVLGESPLDATIAASISTYEKEGGFGAGYHVEMLKHGAILKQVDAAAVDIRKEINPAIKDQLGLALWGYLLSCTDDDGPVPEKLRCDLRPSPTIDSKLHQLSQKHSPAIWIDAGTTTQAAMHAFLHELPIPLRTIDRLTKAPRLVRPIFYTNSEEIVAAVVGSHHRLNVRVRVLGGELNPESRSISGHLAESCLSGWNICGDVAIVGATGARRERGGMSFCASDLSECQVKGRFLEACWIRIVVADSTKIPDSGDPSRSQNGRPDGITNTHSFVPIENGALDLIVLDDGAATGRAEVVSNFVHHAQSTGVACLIVKTLPLKNAPRPIKKARARA